MSLIGRVSISVSEKPWYLMQKLYLQIINEEKPKWTKNKKHILDIDFQRIQAYEGLEEEKANNEKCHDKKNTRIRRYIPGSIAPRWVSLSLSSMTRSYSQGPGQLPRLWQHLAEESGGDGHWPQHS